MNETVTNPWWRGPRGLAALAVAAVVVVVLVVALVRGGSGDADPTAASTTATPSGAPTEAVPSATPSVAPTPTASAPSAGPSATPSSGSRPTSGASAAPPLPGSRPAVALDEAAPVATDVVVRVVRITRVQGEARGPGEVAGPALKVDFRLANRSGRAVPVSDAVANLDFGRSYAPASPLLDDERAKPFTGSVAPGESATASYVFSVDGDDETPVRVTFSSSAGSAAVVFEGRA